MSRMKHLLMVGVPYTSRWIHYSKNLVLVRNGPYDLRWFHRQFAWFGHTGELLDGR